MLTHRLCDMGLRLEKLLLMVLSLQLTIMPVIPGYAAHGHFPLSVDKPTFISEHARNHSLNHHSKNLHKEKLCSEQHGINTRCSSCICIYVGLFSPAMYFSPISKPVDLNVISSLGLYHIYLIPPFKPPIT